MSEQQFQKEVMDELAMDDIPYDYESRVELEEVCLYCGEPRMDKIGCCGENHFGYTRD